MSKPFVRSWPNGHVHMDMILFLCRTTDLPDYYTALEKESLVLDIAKGPRAAVEKQTMAVVQVA